MRTAYSFAKQITLALDFIDDFLSFIIIPPLYEILLLGVEKGMEKD